MIDKDLEEEGYTEDHFCISIESRAAKILGYAIDFIAKKDGNWIAVCEDEYYKDIIFYCPFCGAKL